MKPMWRTLGIILLAGATAWGVNFFMQRGTEDRHSHNHSNPEQDFHQWMHDRLELSEEQHLTLYPVEKVYEQKRQQLTKEITSAGNHLAIAVRQGNPEAPEIQQALEQLNRAQAELQKATLEHFFAMKKHLNPEQAEKLLEWTHDSIIHE